jgi:hypothetical protein
MHETRRRVPTRTRRAIDGWSRRMLPGEARYVVWLVLLTLGLGVLLWFLPGYTPLMLLVVPLLLASILLSPRRLPWFVVFLLLVLATVSPKQAPVTPRIAIGIAVLFALGLIVMVLSYRRTRLGVGGLRGESMLVDLRDRILSQGRIPPLPDGWYAARELRSAGGTAFAGDFVVAACAEGRLGVAVVDVSGKGEGAGTRALLLSGALGGLIAAVPHDQFLPAANEFLIRQDWDEGFATAVHLSVDLTTGGFTVRTAGHPPAAYLSSGSGRWSVLESAGPLLGLIDGAEFEPVEGKLARGDALLLYTDGLVETPGRDIMLGIDRLLGQAERLLTGGMDGGAERLIETLGSRNDDRALLLVHRR